MRDRHGDALEAERVDDLQERAGSLAIVDVGFVEHGDPTLLVTEPEHASLPFGRTGNGGSHPRTRTARPWPAAAIRPDHTRVDLGELSVAFPSIQPLPGDEVLVVGSRCRPGDDNALVFSPDGTRHRSFCAGDGIQSVQTNRAGDIWVSYYVPFDLVRVDRDGRTRGWATDVRGVTAVAVHRERVVFFGGYDDDRNAARRGVLDRSPVRTRRTKICDSHGRRLHPDVVVGRGRFLHLLAGTVWWRVDLAAMIT